MLIQLNGTHDLTIHESFAEQLKATLSGGLKHFSEHITRLEAHLSDENGGKKGEDDKRCVLEARLEGRQPVVVTANAGNHEEAVKAALAKLIHALDTVIDKLKTHHGRENSGII